MDQQPSTESYVAGRSASEIILRDPNTLGQFSQVFSRYPEMQSVMRSISATTRTADIERIRRENCYLNPSLNEVEAYFDTRPLTMCTFVVSQYEPDYDGIRLKARLGQFLPTFSDKYDKYIGYTLSNVYSQVNLVDGTINDGQQLNFALKNYRSGNNNGNASHIGLRDIGQDGTRGIQPGQRGVQTDDMYTRDVVGTTLHLVDVLAYHNIFRQRETCLDIADFAHTATIRHFRNTIQYLSRDPFIIYHLHLYLMFNATVLGIKVPRFLVEQVPDLIIMDNPTFLQEDPDAIYVRDMTEYEQVKMEYRQRWRELADSTYEEREQLIATIVNTIRHLQ